jgi:hypothetical protein
MLQFDLIKLLEVEAFKIIEKHLFNRFIADIWGLQQIDNGSKSFCNLIQIITIT